jgi:hypothetical protein
MWICVSMLAAASIVTVSQAHAQKNKPGLFDFDVPKLPYQYERDAAKDISPGTVDLTPAAVAKGDARVLKVRVYADNDYRNVILQWKSKARAQINRINGVVQPVFNLRFEVDSQKDWNESHIGMALPAVLDRLRTLDRGTDVDLVVAFTTPLQGVAASIHAIGEAELLGRHFVMRGMDDDQEALAIDREFKLLDPEERRRLYGSRKSHKEIVVFLHEWGHTLGLLHHEEATNIMNPRYDPRQASFSDFAKQLITAVVDRRVANRSELHPETADVVRLLETAPADEGGAGERAELLAFARQRARGGGRDSGKPGGGGGDVDLPPADVDAFNLAVGELNARHPEVAWGQLAPVIERASKRKVAAKTWARLAGLASAMGALTAAENAAAQGGGGAHAELGTIANDVASVRQQVCLPRAAETFGVAPANEPAYVAGYWDTARGVASLEVPAARERLRTFAERFPDAPGVELLACDLELRARRLPAASKRCGAAVDKCKESGRAYYLMGMVAANSGKHAVAEQSLQKAIKLDPTDEGPWMLLARIYRHTRSKKQLADLAARHQTLLSTPLPKE